MEKVQQTYRKPEELFVSNEVLNVIPGVDGVYHAQGNFKKNGDSKNGSIDLSKDISEIFDEANAFFPDDQFTTSYQRRKIVPFSGLDGDGKYLNNILNGNTRVDFGSDLNLSKTYFQPTEGYQN
ncbi:MAG: hypothetical protein ACMXX8_02215 [Candidatus Woesearchaeota archaeon]